MPRSAGAQPYSYLHPRLGDPDSVSNLDTTPLFAFGHGLSYTSFELTDLAVGAPQVATSGRLEVSCRVTNTGGHAGEHVVQLYARDVVASVTRPVRALVGYARVRLAVGQSAKVSWSVPTTRLALSDRELRRVVEPGQIELIIAHSSATSELSDSIELTGPIHHVTIDDPRITDVTVQLC